MTTPLQARPIPDIVTELPGPKARTHIEFDHAWTSPSLPRAYPIVPVRGLGCAVEPTYGVTTYPVIGEPFAAGATQDNVAEPFPATASGAAGASGTAVAAFFRVTAVGE